MPASVVRDPSFLEHDAGRGHPESPARLAAIGNALDAARLTLVEVPAREATEAELRAAHAGPYVERLLGYAGRSVVLDPDTRTGPGSVNAARRAAGGSIDLALGVARGEVPPGIALVRPPGHHATREAPMGFCLFNNVALAAYALRAEGLRVAIYDFDVHHGNGTEDIFDEDPEVLFVSTHQSPLYPGTGPRSHEGSGRGRGATLNLPLPAGTGDARLLAVIDEHVIPKIRAFGPDAILLSAGFDGHADDPLGGFAISDAGYSEIARRMRALAEELAGGRIAAFLEGGYDGPALGRSVVRLLEAFGA